MGPSLHGRVVWRLPRVGVLREYVLGGGVARPSRDWLWRARLWRRWLWRGRLTLTLTLTLTLSLTLTLTITLTLTLTRLGVGWVEVG